MRVSTINFECMDEIQNRDREGEGEREGGGGGGGGRRVNIILGTKEKGAYQNKFQLKVERHLIDLVCRDAEGFH